MTEIANLISNGMNKKRFTRYKNYLIRSCLMAPWSFNVNLIVIFPCGNPNFNLNHKALVQFVDMCHRECNAEMERLDRQMRPIAMNQLGESDDNAAYFRQYTRAIIAVPEQWREDYQDIMEECIRECGEKLFDLKPVAEYRSIPDQKTLLTQFLMPIQTSEQWFQNIIYDHPVMFIPVACHPSANSVPAGIVSSSWSDRV